MLTSETGITSLALFPKIVDMVDVARSMSIITTTLDQVDGHNGRRDSV